jgi:hypothetical protein
MYFLDLVVIQKSIFRARAMDLISLEQVSSNAHRLGNFSSTAFPYFRDDIQTCQNLGKIVLLSLGGAVGTYGFSSSAQASTFATTLWDMFGEGWGSTRPFGWVLVDGFDLGFSPHYCTALTRPDIENGKPNYYTDFINAMRSYSWYGSKYYYITGAPQYPPQRPLMLTM